MTTRRSRFFSWMLGLALLLATIPGTAMAQVDAAVARTVAAATPTMTPNTSYDGLSFTGQTLRYYPRGSYPECDVDCQKDPNCRGWTWVKPGGYKAGDAAMCYLVSRIDSVVRHSGSVSAIKGATGGVAGTPPPPPITTPPAQSGNWSAWISPDDPGATADYDWVSFPNNEVACAQPTAVECRVRADKRDWRQTGQRYKCAIEGNQGGGICLNADNPGGCLDYEVRFLCPAR